MATRIDYKVSQRIYALSEPEGREHRGKIRYLGRTAQPLPDRLNGHLSDARCSEMDNQALRTWILDLEKQGLRPDIDTVAYCYSDMQAQTSERFYIKLYAEVYPDLLNLQHNPYRRQTRPFRETYLKRIGAA